MLIITDVSLSLLKYHVNENLSPDIILLVKYVNDIKILESLLLEELSYNKEGDLCKCVYIVYYTGTRILSKDFYQNKNNVTYLVVENIDLYKQLFKEGKAIKSNINALQYKHNIEHAKSILTIDTFDYFWSEYCVKKFNSNPVKWNLELRRLLFVFTENNKQKLTIEDIDILYNKVSDFGLQYLQHMFTDSSTFYLNKVKKEDLFILFIKGPKLKSSVLRSIELHNQNALFSYMCFKESFYKGYIKITEGVYILDYLIKNNILIDYVYIRNLFKLT